MRSRGHALVWEYWAFGWRGILLCLLAMLGVPLFLYGIIYLQDVDVRLSETFPVPMLHFNLLLVNLFIATAAALGAAQTRHRLFTLPISTWFWLAWKLPLAMGTAVLMYLLPAAMANRLFAADWPLWGPALFYAATVAMVHAATVSARSDGFRVLLCTVVAALLFGWLLNRYSSGESYSPDMLWSTVTVVDLLTLGSLIVAGYVVSAVAMQRDRRGESLVGWTWPRSLPGWQGARRRFVTASSAQFWFEWKEKGLVLPASIAILLTFVLILPAFDAVDDGVVGLIKVSKGLVGFILMFAPVVLGLMIGLVNRAGVNRPMGHFRASRPLADAQLSGAVLRAGVTSLLLTFLVIAVYLLIVATWLMNQGHELQLRRAVAETLLQFQETTIKGTQLHWWFLAAVYVWTATWLIASLALSGRISQTIWVVGVLFAGTLLFFLARFLPAFPGRIIMAGCLGTAVAIGFACLPVTIWAFRVALRGAIIDRETAWIATGLWLALVLIGLPLSVMADPTPPLKMALIVSLLALPVAPLATAPLAVSWNRHR